MLALIPALAPILDKVLGAVLPDPEARAKAITNIFGELSKADLGQMEINREEAKSSSIFVAGWRPFIGWVCGAALFYSYILVPITLYVGFVIGKPLPKPPVLDANLWELMFGMLGMGALRTYEKIQKVAGK